MENRAFLQKNEEVAACNSRDCHLLRCGYYSME